YNDTDALLRQLIWYALRRANLTFAFPTRTLHLERKGPMPLATGPQKEVIERLSAVDIFAPLSNEETEKLAGGAVRHIFAPGELVIRAGDQGASMFVVHSGRVQVQISDGGQQRPVAVLSEGAFFGEMALFTGEPRTANVVALEETEVLEIGHDAMKHLFETNPDLAESISWTIAERRAGLEASSQQGAAVAKAESAGLLNSIKRFFGLR
ncbi:MAG: cyclic nucleotide-binding domain-containing protein, partial [Pyrinomonadaceae bacterium]